MKAAPIISSFNGGELTPLLAGRVDVAKYAIGCKRMEGFIPVTQGPAVSRPGTPFVAEVKDSTKRTWLRRFEFSAEDAYMIEVGDQYMRFYTNRGQVLSGGVPYEISTPFVQADLTNADGTFALGFVGTGDEIFIVHPNYPPQLLARHGPTNWTIGPIDFEPPPFGIQNSSTTTVYASAGTGSVTLVASAATFTAADVGTFFYLGERDVRDVAQWEPAKSITTGNVRRSNGINYKALNTATTGTIRPTHTSGAVKDGDTGVQWQFEDPGYGWAKITAFSDTTHVTATVVSAIPDGAVGSGQASTRWAKQAWNDSDGWPSAITFFRERLVFARGSQVWFSVPDDFFNFSYQLAGAVTADSGFDRTLASSVANEIRWLSPGDVLLVGTVGDEWAIVEASTQEAFGPNNCKTSPQSAYGSNRVAPQRVGTDTVFVQKSGRKVRAMAFRFEDDGFSSPDVTVFAEHVTKTKIQGMAFQQEPWGVLWAWRGDGQLVGLTLNREQAAVAWHRHPFADGIVECVSCIPAPSGERDDPWLIVRYTISGQTRRYIAYIGDEDTDDTEPADWCYSDMCLTYRGAPATTITGLDHLEGKTVWVLVDGARHVDCFVGGGKIHLQVPGSVVTVGLPSPGYLMPMDIEGGSGNGTAQGKVKRAHAVTVRLNRTCGAVAGPSEERLGELKYRRPLDLLGQGLQPYTGDAQMDWPGDYDTQLPILIKKDRPQPVTVCAIMPQYVVSEGK
jgi:hypothetical protein